MRRATSISSSLLVYDVSKLSVELAVSRYTSLSDNVSRVFQPPLTDTKLHEM